jgi:predicted DNA-binding transcriptional regulator AlpA
VTPVHLDPARSWLTRDEAAKLWGDITPGGFSSLVSKGLAPQPATYVGRTPMWDAAEVEEWKARRPGRGNWRN